MKFDVFTSDLNNFIHNLLIYPSIYRLLHVCQSHTSALWCHLNSPLLFLITRAFCRRFPPKYIEITLKAIQSTFRSLEMHSKRRYEICICSVILGELEYFRNNKDFSSIFPENFRCNLTYFECENFPDSFFHHIFESGILGFLFSFFSKPGECNVKNLTSENRRKLIR